MHSRTKRLIKPIICFVLCIILIFVGFKVFEKLGIFQKKDEPVMDYSKDLEVVYIDGVPYKHRLGTDSLLIIGVDIDGKMESNGSYNNSAQSDFITLLVTNNISKEFWLVHLNRDTMTYMDALGFGGKKTDTIYAQLALAHTYGDGMEISCQNTVRAVSNLLYGIKIDKYFSMTMDAVKVFTDYVNGVNVTMDQDYTEIDNRFISGNTVLLDGNSALSFIRSRQGLSDSTNLSRMNRQKLFINSFFIKMAGMGSDFNIKGCYDKVNPYILTDYSYNDIIDIYNKLTTFKNNGTVSPEGSTVVNQYTEFYVDEASLKSIIMNMFFEPVNITSSIGG